MPACSSPDPPMASLEGLSSTVTFGDFLTPSQIDQGQPGATTGELWWCSKRNPGSGLTKLFIALGWGLFNLRSSKYVQSWKTSCPPSCDFAWVSDMKHKDHMGPVKSTGCSESSQRLVYAVLQRHEVLLNPTDHLKQTHRPALNGLIMPLIMVYPKLWYTIKICQNIPKLRVL